MFRKALILLMLTLPLAASAQENTDSNAKTHAVYLELGGGSTEVGVSYDQRFSKDSHWGWRAGLSFAYSGSESFFMESSSTRAWAVPLEVNYLVGSRKNSLELGIGASLGLYNCHYNEVSFQNVGKETFDDYMAHPEKYPDVSGGYSDESGTPYYTFVRIREASGNYFGYFLFGDVAYRHVANSGFVFRAGLSPALNFGGKHGVFRGFGNSFKHFSVIPTLAFGWAF